MKAKGKRNLPVLSQEAYDHLESLFERFKNKEMFEENPMEMLELLLAEMKYKSSKYFLGDYLVSLLHEVCSPEETVKRRRRKAEESKLKAA